MDLYLSAEESLTLQEILETDIKCELDSVWTGGSGEEFGFTHIDTSDENSCSNMNMNLSWHAFNSSNQFDLISDDALMVNLNSVIPLSLQPHHNKLKLEMMMSGDDGDDDDEDNINPLYRTSSLSPITTTPSSNGGGCNGNVLFGGGFKKIKKEINEDDNDNDLLKIKTEPDSSSSSPQTIKFNTISNTSLSSPSTSKTKTNASSISNYKITSNNGNIGNVINNGNVLKTFSVSNNNKFGIINNTLVPNNSNKNNNGNIVANTNIIRTLNGNVVGNKKIIPIAKKSTKRKYTDRKTLSMQKFNNQLLINSINNFPKPAYSYSCLIAMALKNSRSGSLPVSEIYSFMCLHFPYFKTAPSGWKNSVRHNLSLNKCFEKIEKPISDNSSRKGCLWAMNPEKISKMDEEVQKWSRKDPLGIKRAMIHPESLESLERGEMKIGSLSYDSPCDVEEDETEEEEEDDGLVNGRHPETESDDDEENELVLPYIPGGSDSEEGETSLDIETNDKFYEEIDIKDSSLLFHSFSNSDYSTIKSSSSSSSSLKPIKKAIFQGNYICQPLIKQRKIVQNNFATQTVLNH